MKECNKYYIVTIGKLHLIRISTNIIEILANLLLYIYWSVIIFNFTVGMDSSKYYYLRPLMNILALVLVFYKVRRNQIIYIRRIFLFIILTFALGFVSSIYNHVYQISDYIYAIFASSGIALLMLQFKMYKITSNALYWIFVIKFIIYFVQNSGNMWYFLEAGGNSRNYISVILFILTSFIFMSYGYRKGRNKYLYVVSIVDLILCILSVGRGGIISGFLLLFLMIYVWLKKSNLKQTLFRIIVVLLLAIVVYLYVVSNGFTDIILGGFATNGTDTPRTMEIWLPYINKLKNPFNLLFGANYLDYISNYGHLHNSYLMVHVRFGLCAVVILVVMLIKASNKIWKNNPFLGMLILVFMVRAFTDSMISFNYCDSVVLYWLFISLKKGDDLNEAKKTT